MAHRHTLLSFVLLACTALPVTAQSDEAFKYMRGSLCMMMVEHPQLEYNKEIEEVFSMMSIPNRFNDHDMGVRCIRFANDKDQQRNITIFGQEQQVAKRMVAKWFDRNKNTGGFDTELLKTRGHYSATQIDVKQARQQVRGMAALEDLGENLISHTYWVVNDIQYVSHNNFASTLKSTLVVAGGVKDMVASTVNSIDNAQHSESHLADSLDKKLGFLDNIKGFRVKVTSYLFRLKWNDEVANTFYTQYYTETPDAEADKVKAFANDRGLFTLEYVGEVTNTSSKTTLSGVKTNEDMIRKVCTRALDKNLADLQHEFADFRIKAPLVSTQPIKAYIGMKEDINAKSRYEVLQMEKDERGITRYKRVGVIKPISGKIWDNRYMADQEGTSESHLDGTYFEKVSGGDFMPGMLIRETK